MSRAIARPVGPPSCTDYCNLPTHATTHAPMGLVSAGELHPLPSTGPLRGAARSTVVLHVGSRVSSRHLRLERLDAGGLERLEILRIWV